MLSPNVDNTVDMLTNVYNDIRSVSNYASTCNSLVIGYVPSDPQWLSAVRNRSAKLRNVMNEFMNEKPDILAEIIASIINYQTLFAAFAANSSDIKTKDEWLQFLALLRDNLAMNIKKTNEAEMAFKQAYNNVSHTEFLLEESINVGWAELVSEEQEMVSIMKAVGALTQSIQNLEVSVAAAEIGAGKSYVKTMVTMAYSVVIGTATSVPYLTIAEIVFTIGKSVYDTLLSSAEIQKKLDELTDLQSKASKTAQATAITKTVLQVLNQLGKSFLKLHESLPNLTLIWQDELDKLNSAIEAIDSGAKPSLLFDLNLQTMKISAASWKTIADFANEIRKPPIISDSVTIDCSNKTITQQR